MLDDLGITLNRNAIPNDPRSPFVTSGLRIGTPSVTTAGMRLEQMITLGHLIVAVLRNIDEDVMLKELDQQIGELAGRFPAYPVTFPGYV